MLPLWVLLSSSAKWGSRIRWILGSLWNLIGEELFSPMPTLMKVKGKEPKLYFFGAHSLILIHRNEYLNQHFPNLNIHSNGLESCEMEDSRIVKIKILVQWVQGGGWDPAFLTAPRWCSKALSDKASENGLCTGPVAQSAQLHCVWVNEHWGRGIQREG